MGFAVPDRTKEVRMEAAYFLQQLCQSRYIIIPCSELTSINIVVIYTKIMDWGGVLLFQLIDVANVYSLPRNTCSCRISWGWLCKIQVFILCINLIPKQLLLHGENLNNYVMVGCVYIEQTQNYYLYKTSKYRVTGGGKMGGLGV